MTPVILKQINKDQYLIVSKDKIFVKHCRYLANVIELNDRIDLRLTYT